MLSATDTFQGFKAVKDVYLPACGLWLSEYPFLSRSDFLQLSLQLEKERREGEGEPDERGGVGAGGQWGSGSGRFYSNWGDGGRPQRRDDYSSPRYY